jgi:hypothetical protein
VHPLSVAILSFIVEGSGGGTSASSVYQAISEAAVMRPSLRLLTSEEMFVADPQTSEQRIEDCGTDASCLATHLAAFDARYGLLAVLNFTTEPPLIGLRLVDTEKRRIVGEFAGPAEGDPLAAIRARAAELFDRAGHAQYGRLLVRTEPPEAEVEIEGTPPLSTSPYTYLLVPGAHRVSARKEGYQEAGALAEAKAGLQSEVTLVLPKIEETPVLESWWLWTIIGGVVVAGTVTAIVLGLRGGDRICVGDSSVLDDC